jgi:DNA-binding MarR family transcriptional regulator
MPAAKPPRFPLQSTARALLDGCPALAARALARQVAQRLDSALASTGLTSGQVALLARVAAAEDDTLGALARRAGVDPSTLSRTLRTLEAAGLVEIALVEADQRRRAVWLTETGARRLARALPLWQAAQAGMAARLSPGLATLLADEAAALADQPLR